MNTEPLDLWQERIMVRRRILAKALAEGEIKTARIAHGKDGFALDLNAELCALCIGSFPPIGFAHLWLDQHGDMKVAHMGCFSEAINWTETE